MTEKQLKKLKRSELLEMLIEQKKINDELKLKLENAEAELKSRRIAIENVGSIAEASLKINGVFEAAQKAAEQYLENIKELNENG